MREGEGRKVREGSEGGKRGREEREKEQRGMEEERGG